MCNEYKVGGIHDSPEINLAWKRTTSNAYKLQFQTTALYVPYNVDVYHFDRWAARFPLRDGETVMYIYTFLKYRNTGVPGLVYR